MNFELTEQSIQFTFGNKKYESGLKNRRLKNVSKDAQAVSLQNVGQAILGLQYDSLDDVVLIQRRRIVEAAK